MTRSLVQLNWQVIWQAAFVFLIGLTVARRLRDRDDADYSLHRTRLWTLVVLSPLAIVPLTAAAGYFGWRHYQRLLVWQWFVPSSSGVLDAAGQLASQTSNFIPGLYLAWLIGYGSLLVVRRVRFRMWRRVYGASAYCWREGEQAVFEELCDRMGLRRRPLVIDVDTKITPLTYGTWNPVIVVEHPLKSRLVGLDQFKAVMAHELTHVKYHHFAVTTLTDVVGWVFPLAMVALWRAKSYLAREMELLADRAAVDAGADPSALRDALEQCKQASDSLRPDADALLPTRASRAFDRPLQAGSWFGGHVSWVPVTWTVVSQLNFMVQPLAATAPLVLAGLAPSLVPQLQSYTHTPRYYEAIDLGHLRAVQSYRYQPVSVPQFPTVSMPILYVDPHPVRAYSRIDIPTVYTPPVYLHPQFVTPPPTIRYEPMRTWAAPSVVPVPISPPAYTSSVRVDPLPALNTKSIPKAQPESR